MIIALSWYAKQGQNNPFIPISVVKFKTIGSITALEFYKKKGKEIYQCSIFPLSNNLKTSSEIDKKIQNYRVFNNFKEENIEKLIKKNCLEFIELNHLVKKDFPNYNSTSLIYSEPIHSLGIDISKLYLSNRDSSIATSINTEGISIIAINDLDLINKEVIAEDLKEKFMIAIISDTSIENAQKVRNLLRPEYLIVIANEQESKAIQNILFVNEDTELRISRSLKGTIKIKNLKS